MASKNFKEIADNYVNNRIMNRLEQLSFDELFSEAKNVGYNSIDEIEKREKEIILSLKKHENTFEGIKLNCELLALNYLKTYFNSNSLGQEDLRNDISMPHGI